ncbi:LysR family transcriptional regulator, partial [Burkholderia diffusa]|nr:LysR family transcriptional regulator [Burkholderia diffusa]
MRTSSAHPSRAVQELEAHLGTRLLNRTTRSFTLTDKGECYLQRCQQILACVEEAESEARDAHARPRGRLKVYSMASLGQHYIVPAIARYQARYPEVQVHLTLEQGVPDLIDEGYDVALVAATQLPDSALISQRIGVTFSIACASPTVEALKNC